jgi:hypothetical protein
MLPFLPNGAHAIVMDYMKTNQLEPWGGKVGDSMHMEGTLWEHFPHVRTDYYTIETSAEYDKNAGDGREAAIIVNASKLKRLVRPLSVCLMLYL